MSLRTTAGDRATIAAGVAIVPSVVIAEVRGPNFELRDDGTGFRLIPGAEAAVYFFVGVLGQRDDRWRRSWLMRLASDLPHR